MCPRTALQDYIATRLSYALVFLPLYLLEAADVAGAAARCRPAAYEAEKAVGRAQLPYFAHLVRVVGWAGAQLAICCRACRLIQ